MKGGGTGGCAGVRTSGSRRGSTGEMAGGSAGFGAVWAGLSGDMSKGDDCAMALVATAPQIITVSDCLIGPRPVILRLQQV